MTYILSDTFDETRSRRCVTITRHIMANWRQANSFNHSISCAEPIAGRRIADICDLRFTITVAHTSYDVPLLDLLAIFDLVAKETKILTEHQGPPEGVKTYSMRTQYTDEAAWSLLSQIGVMPLVNG